MSDNDLVEMMMEDLGIEPSYNGKYAGWLVDLCERLIDSGWKKKP